MQIDHSLLLSPPRSMAAPNWVRTSTNRLNWLKPSRRYTQLARAPGKLKSRTRVVPFSTAAYFHKSVFSSRSVREQSTAQRSCLCARQSRANILILTSRQRYDDPDARLPAYEVRGKVKVHRLAGTRFGRRHSRPLNRLSLLLCLNGGRLAEACTRRGHNRSHD